MQEQRKKITLPSLIFYILFASSLILSVTAIVSKKRTTGKASSDKNLVVMEINGALSYKTCMPFVKAVRKYSEMPSIKGIILKINSPGGTAGGVQELYSEIIRFRKKGKVAIASFGDIAASGGYYIAMACDKVVSNPSSMVGSVGVIMNTMNYSNLMKRFGVESIVVKSGKFKDILSSFRQSTPQELALLQELVNDTFEEFFKAVKTSRKNIPEAKLREICDGRIFTGNSAHKLKMVDELGGFYKAVDIFKKLTNTSKVNILNFKSGSLNIMSLLRGTQSRNGNIAQKLREIFTSSEFYSPIYYLYTGI
jgi:protease-4